jgi:tetratricopeptide (TPR) repeat protein
VGGRGGSAGRRGAGGRGAGRCGAAGIVHLALVASLALTALGCGGGAVRLPAGTPVVLVSIDTLRSDHLPAYGYRGVATPAIDELAGDGIRFEHAYSPTPLTLPAHTSLLTGLLPGDHGVRDNVGYLLDSQAVTAGKVPFLPELLHRAGYATGGAVSAFVLRGRTGLATGFDFYEDSIEFRTRTGLGGLQRPGAETLARCRDWLRGAAGKPFFLFFHLYEPHTPYAPPEPFASRYPLPYDGEIAEADRVVGELLGELRRLGVYERSLVILVGDHGEGLGDHGEDEHGVLLYREAIQVPLIVKLPDRRLAGTVVAAPAGLVDVVPTVVELLGLPRPGGLAGTSLLALTGADAPQRRIYSETFYPRLHFGWNELASLIDGRHHFIAGPDPELYDLAADPGERHNGLGDDRRLAVDLRGELAGYQRALAPPGAVDPSTRQALAALGYVGTAVPGGAGPLPDPKAQLGTLADLKAGFALHAQGDFAAAAAAFRRVLDGNPRMVDAWEFLGRCLERLGKDDEALDAYRQALEISGGSPDVALTAASLYLELGRLDEAEKHARLAVATHPSFAHGLLAQVALAREDLDGAEREAREAMTEEPFRIGPMIALAAVRHARGDYEGAQDLVRQAAAAYAERQAQDPELIKGLHLVEGKIRADLGDAAGAEKSFDEEIRLFPRDVRAYSNLAILRALAGHPGEAGLILQRMVAANGSAAAYAEAVKTLRILGDPAAAAALLRFARGKYPGEKSLRALEKPAAKAG